ncbi:MAG: transglutaminase domain-containing protein [Candidatus Omnitrophica bacterium]|nr:transglutaminase domain-containing protein [Candidatus Omnitrophota bacterium]
MKQLTVILPVFCLFLFSFCKNSAPSSQNTEDSVPDVYISGIIAGAPASPETNQGGPYTAIVNGKLVKEGDVTGKIKIISIDSSSVVYEYQGKTFRKLIGQGASRQRLPFYTEKDSASTETAEKRKELFIKYSSDYFQKAKANYEKAKEAYGKNDELAALGYYEAAVRDAQGAYLYADDVRKRELQQFMDECSSRSREIRGEPSNLGDLESYNLKTPEEIAQWLEKHIQYKSDETVQEKRDYWQKPEETLMLESGDCEDLAFLAQAFLQEIGISSWVVTIEENGKDNAHALCVFGRTPPYNCIDGTTLVIANKQTIEELVRELYPDYYIINQYVAYTSRSIPILDDNDDVILPR